ncbi:MAG: hypothetical protein K1W19_05010 [Lachnospiraceae bacterium]
MNEFFERGMLWMIPSVLLISFSVNINITAYILTGFIFSCLGVFMEYRRFNFILSVCFAVLTFFFPYLGVYSGIIFYQIILKKDSLIIYEKIFSFATVFLLFFHISGAPLQAFLFFLVFLLSVHMASVLSKLNLLKKQAAYSRDEHFEEQKLLKTRYDALRERQDHEIQVATLSERNRIAREIHDNVGHMLSRSILQLGALLAVYKNTDTYALLIPLKDSLDEAMTSIRNSVHDLHKKSIDFEASFYRITSEMSGYEMNLFCDLPKNLPEQIAYSFITVLREALTNIQKHSDADTVKVTARELSNYYQLIIEDNGHSNVQLHKKRTGIGLKNMEDRIQSLQGLIYFSCQNGFRIFISVPKQNYQEEKS